MGISRVIASLRFVLRTPSRPLRSYLAEWHGLLISSGEIVALLQRGEEQTRAETQRLTAQGRARPVGPAAETGWREDGRPGSCWSARPAEGVRSCDYPHSRAGQVSQPLLGADVTGVLGSDCSGGSTDLAGLQQRCGVPWRRDGQDLKAKAPSAETVQVWSQALSALYRHAISLKGAGEPAYADLLAQAKHLGGSMHPARPLPAEP